jgi:hypothetical protein
MRLEYNGLNSSIAQEWNGLYHLDALGVVMPIAILSLPMSSCIRSTVDSIHPR